MHRPHLAFLLENLDGEDGTGETQRESNQHRQREVQVGKERQAGQAEAEDPDTESHDCGRHVDRRAGPDFRLGQALQVELETDREEQQRHTEVSEGLQCLTALEAEPVE